MNPLRTKTSKALGATRCHCSSSKTGFPENSSRSKLDLIYVFNLLLIVSQIIFIMTYKNKTEQRIICTWSNFYLIYQENRSGGDVVRGNNKSAP